MVADHNKTVTLFQTEERSGHSTELKQVLDGVRTLGLTAGASAPEALVQELLGRLAERYTLSVEERRVTEETLVFRLPAPLN